MHFLLVNRYYGGSHVPTGRMLWDLGQELRRRGHEVRVFTSGDTYVPSESGGPSAGEESILRLWTGGSRRLFSWVLFWLQVCLRLPLAKWDRCIVLTDPPFMIWAAPLARLLRPRRRIYWWTMDLYPEALVAHGMLKAEGWAHRCLRWLNDIGLRSTTGVICLGQGQRARLRTYKHFRDSSDFACVVPPWDNRLIPCVPRQQNRFLAKYGWGPKRVALYAGNLGEAHCFRELLEAAREFQHQGDQKWMFVFVVRGASKARLQAEAAGLANVAVLDYQPPELTADLLWAADVHLITMSDGWQGIVVPSKLYGVIKTEAPVLFIGPPEADTAEAIRTHGWGKVLPIGSSGKAVAASLEELLSQGTGRNKRSDDQGCVSIADFVCRE